MRITAILFMEHDIRELVSRKKTDVDIRAKQDCNIKQKQNMMSGNETQRVDWHMTTYVQSNFIMIKFTEEN